MWIIILVLLLIILLIYWMFPVIEVCGNSMHPTYIDGEVLICCRIYNKKKIKNGDVFIFSPPKTYNPEVEYVIKRVCDVREKDGHFFFMGDNRDDSYDSRNYGHVDPNRLVAKVINQRKMGENYYR